MMMRLRRGTCQDSVDRGALVSVTVSAHYTRSILPLYKLPYVWRRIKVLEMKLWPILRHLLIPQHLLFGTTTVLLGMFLKKA